MALLRELLLILKTYLYGIGWMVIAVTATIVAMRAFLHYVPLDCRRELDKGNPAYGIMLGLFLLALTFGTLYLAAHLG